MIKLSAQDFASVVSGSLHDISPSQILDQDPIINSKDASAKNFFVAFKGEKFDGHDFVSEALISGAKFSLVSKSVSGPHVLVATVATAGNFNTDIGVPLTLLRSTEATKFCILEMGARHVGDIAKLTELANPNVGVVLVVGTAHLGEFGSVEAIAKTKSELIKALSPKMTAVLGTYDQFTPKMADSLDLNTVLFGDGQIVRAADVELHGGFAHFDLVTPAGRNSVALQVIGEHQIPNALAAAAAAFSLGVKNESIAIGLTTALLSSKWRMQIETINGIQIIHDYYNANPESMKAALKTLVMLSQESGGASWAILGKMHELGSKESSGHLEVAEFASQLGVDHLVSVAPAVYQESNNQSSDENMLIHNCSSAAAVLELVNNISTGDVILLKASRSEKFEDLAELIKKALEGDQA